LEDPVAFSLRALLESAGIPFTVVEFPPDHVLFRQGDKCGDAWCLEAGRVRLAVTTAGGQEAVFTVLRAGSLLSDDVLAGHQDYRHSAVSIEPTVVLRVPRERMIALLHTEGAILDHFLGHMVAQHIELENTLVHQMLYLAEERLAHTLIRLAQCDGVSGRCLLPHLSQEVIAEMIGTTRSRVNLFMRRFKDVGFLETSGGQTFVHSSRLARAVHRGPTQSSASPVAHAPRGCRTFD
jgi:CRP/FNR family cyclic AMP-dependent transcriptional regulator